MVKVVQTVLHEKCEDEDEHTPEVQGMAAERPEDCVLCLLCGPDLNEDEQVDQVSLTYSIGILQETSVMGSESASLDCHGDEG